MQTLLAIKKLGNGDDWLSGCCTCSKSIDIGSHYIKYGAKYGAKNYHLTCFNKFGKKEIKKADLCYNNINTNLKRIEDFKKRVQLMNFKPIMVNNIAKNITNFKIKISDRFYNQHTCEECGEKIDLGDIYIDHGSQTLQYHFACFQKYAKKRLNKWKTYKIEVQNNLNKLEPYKNEMICESLEKE